jgi:hypothetical protein
MITPTNHRVVLTPQSSTGSSETALAMDSTTDYLARLDEAVDSTGNLNEISAFEI